LQQPAAPPYQVEANPTYSLPSLRCCEWLQIQILAKSSALNFEPGEISLLIGIVMLLCDWRFATLQILKSLLGAVTLD